MSNSFWGKYRGIVTNNVDPEQSGRICANVPAVFAKQQSLWAMPCVAPSLSGATGSALPRIGAVVWIEFEAGDPNMPIWCGCFFTNAADTPTALKNT